MSEFHFNFMNFMNFYIGKTDDFSNETEKTRIICISNSPYTTKHRHLFLFVFYGMAHTLKNNPRTAKLKPPTPEREKQETSQT